MTDQKERITLSVPEDETDLLDALDELVEEGIYESRSHAIRDALKRKYSPEEYWAEKVNEESLFDAAHTSYIEAHQRGLDDIKENARNHIIDRYGRTRMLDKIDELLEY